MNKFPEFTEVQSYRKSVLKFVLLGGALVFFYVYFRQEIFDNPVSGNYSDPNGLISGGAVLLVLFILAHYSRLKTVINRKGVKFRFVPFHWRYRHYPWSDIKSAEVKSYSMIKEFGGWGLRYSFKRKGWVFSLEGSNCVEITKKDGRQTILGTQKPDELKKVLKAYVK